MWLAPVKLPGLAGAADLSQQLPSDLKQHVVLQACLCRKQLPQATATQATAHAAVALRKTGPLVNLCSFCPILLIPCACCWCLLLGQQHSVRAV